MVTVTLSHQSSAILLTVGDDGPGIAREHHEKVFERFFRANAQTGPDGTGLGLAIVQSAASRMGASVEIAPEGPGTHISVRFAAEQG